ncbi:MAG: tyrosine-type recombinase/integrase [Hungatella sp.]|jgi:integrase/recombinase XerD|nr:tyrosine-type recombinase/integrase [Hungatella sp.]
MKLSADFNDFSCYLQERKLSDTTIVSYIGSIRLYISLYSSVTAASSKKYRTYLIKNYKPSTVNQRICGFNHYLDYLGKPQYKLSAVRLQRSSYLDAVISNRDYLSLKRKLKKNGPELWFYVVWFLGATGARVSELLKIKVEHLSSGYMDLYTKGGKMRRIYIPDTLCSEAAAWCHRRGTPSGYLFINRRGRPLTARGVHSQLKHFAKLYRINPDTVYPHSFRHRFAINFLQRFNDIALLADLLGHDNVETTRIYLTRSTSEQQKMIDRLVTW